jgi:hypothetical protein
VLEDDCVPSDGFFPFCAELLDRYRDDARVMHVSGECYRARREGTYSYFFSKYPLAWGWATWRRAWAHFDPRLTSWPRFRLQPEAISLFDTEDERRYWFDTFSRMHAGRAPGGDGWGFWDYAWYYACMTQGLSIHPTVNMISNVGFDAVASNTVGASDLAGRAHQTPGETLCHPSWVLRDRQADLDIFDRRFPGALLKRQRSLRHQIGRPSRWAARLLRASSPGSSDTR